MSQYYNDSQKDFSQDVQDFKLSESIKICIKNGDRLAEDARYLSDFERYASAYALVKLAQEEYAKCFILKLVEGGALKWTKEVRRSLNHHISKQLMFIILEYLNPDTDDLLKMINNKTLLERPERVSDAINLYVHEILSRWESQSWVWAENPKYDKEAKSVFNGRDDKFKQDSLYIKISKDGSAVDSTVRYTRTIIENEIEKAERYKRLVSEDSNDFRYKEILEIIKSLKK